MSSNRSIGVILTYFQAFTTPKKYTAIGKAVIVLTSNNIQDCFVIPITSANADTRTDKLHNKSMNSSPFTRHFPTTESLNLMITQ